MSRLFTPLLSIAIVLWLILPLVPLFVWAISQGWFFPNLLPPRFTLQALHFITQHTSNVPQAFYNSTLIGLVVTALCLIIGVPAGRALGVYQFKAKKWILLFLLLPLIMPPITASLGIHVVFLRAGLTNHLGGVILVHLIPTLPYMILVMASVFSRFETRFEDQARTLGSTKMDVLWRVTLPIVAPGMAVGALFVFLVSFSQYTLTLVIGGGRVATLPLIIFNFANAGRNDVAAALSLLFMLPGLLILLISLRLNKGRQTVPELVRA